MPLSAGSFGSIPFIVPEILSAKIKETSGYVVIPMLAGYPRVHYLGDNLDEVSVDFRFSSMPGIGYNASAKSKLDLLRAERGSPTSKTLTLGGVAMGYFVLSSIDWEIISQAGTMKPIVIDASVNFLANPV
jgi:hypothetical protein